MRLLNKKRWRVASRKYLLQRLRKAERRASRPCSNLTEVRGRCDPMLCRPDGAEEELVQIARCKVARRLYDAGCRNACAIKAGWRQIITDEREHRRLRIRDGKCDVRGSKPERVRNNATWWEREKRREFQRVLCVCVLGCDAREDPRAWRMKTSVSQ